MSVFKMLYALARIWKQILQCPRCAVHGNRRLPKVIADDCLYCVIGKGMLFYQGIGEQQNLVQRLVHHRIGHRATRLKQPSDAIDRRLRDRRRVAHRCDGEFLSVVNVQLIATLHRRLAVDAPFRDRAGQEVDEVGYDAALAFPSDDLWNQMGDLDIAHHDVLAYGSCIDRHHVEMNSEPHRRHCVATLVHGGAVEDSIGLAARPRLDRIRQFMP